SVQFCYQWFFFSSRRRHTRFDCDWSSDVCSSDLRLEDAVAPHQKPSFIESSRSCSGAYSARKALIGSTFVARRGGRLQLPPPSQIGRASCREKCRCLWWAYHEKKKR